MWGEPPAAIAARVARVRALAAEQGRTLRTGHAGCTSSPAHTADEAWAEADRLLAGMSPDRIAAAQARFARMDSVGQARMAALHGGGSGRARRSRRTCGPASAWSARARAPRWSAATPRSPPGSTSTPRCGVDEFILSGWPHREEAERVGAEVLPRVTALPVAVSH